MAVAAFLVGIAAILAGGIKIIILGIMKLMGAQKFTATITEYKQIKGSGNRMYLAVEHEKMPERMWLSETAPLKNGKPEREPGETVDVYWIPGRKTAMPADSVKRNAISMLIGVTAIAIGIVLMIAGAAVE